MTVEPTDWFLQRCYYYLFCLLRITIISVVGVSLIKFTPVELIYIVLLFLVVYFIWRLSLNPDDVDVLLHNPILNYKYVVQCDEDDFFLKKRKSKKLSKKIKSNISVNPCIVEMPITINKDSTPFYYREGLVFDDCFYKDIILNEGLTTLHWVDVACYIKNLRDTQFNCTNDAQVSYCTELRRLLDSCPDPTSFDLTTGEVDQIKQLLVFGYAGAIIDDKSYRCQKTDHIVDGCPFIHHPEIRMPTISHSNFVPVCETRCNDARIKRCPKNKRDRGYLEPLFECGQSPNFLQIFFSAMSFMCSKHMTISRILSICKNATLKDQNLLEIFSNKCYVPTYNHLVSDYESGAYTKLAWVLPYVPRALFLYSIHFDRYDRNVIIQYQRFFVLFLSMCVELKNNIFKFVRRYIEVSKMTTSERLKYNKDLKENFANIMKTQQVQLMFMANTPRDDILESVYFQHYNSIRTQAVQQPSILLRKLKTKKLRRIDRSKLRDYKYQTQSSPSDGSWNVANVAFSSSIFGIMFGVFYQIFCFVRLNALFRCIRQWYVDWYNFLYVNPVIRLSNRINSVVREVNGFLTNSNATLSNEVIIMFIEIKALIHVIMAVCKSDFNTAIDHASYFAISRIQIVKEIILFLPQTFSERANVRQDWVFNDHVYHLTVQEWSQLCSIRGPYDTLYMRYHRFADSLNRYEVQDANFDSWIKPLSKLISAITNGDMDEKDVRDANALYQYMNHRSAFLCDNMTLAKNVISFVFFSLFSFDPFDPDFQQFVSDLMSLVSFVEDTFPNQGKLPVDKTLMLQVLEKHQQMNMMLIHPRFLMIHRSIQQHVNMRARQLEHLANISHAYLQNTHCRNTPVCTLMTGPPGTGKSETSKLIRDSISQILKYENPGPHLCYVHNVDAEFHEGYAQQPFTIIDDIFKYKEVEKRSAEAGEIINMVNTTPYNMSMAAVELKGRAFYDSDFVMLTTNIADKGLNKCNLQLGMTQNAAFLRRLHLVLHRDERGCADPADNVFRVDKCEEIPEIVGKSYKAADITKFMLRLRKMHEQKARLLQNDRQSIQNLFPEDLNDVYEEFKTLKDRQRLFNPNVPQDFQVQSDPDDLEFVKRFEEKYTNSGQDDDFIQENLPSDSPFTNKPFDNNSFGVYESVVKAKPLTTYEYITAVLRVKFFNQNPDSELTIKKIRFYTMVFFILLGMTTAASAFYFWNTMQTETQSAERKKKSGARARHKNEAFHRKLVASKPKHITQSANDNYIACLTTNVAACCVKLRAQVFTKDHVAVPQTGNCAHGFHYADGYYVTPAHFMLFYENISDDEYVKLGIQWTTAKGEKKYIETNLPKFWSVEDEDICIFHLQNTQQIPKALKNYVWTNNDVASIPKGTSMQMLSLTDHGAPTVKDLIKVHDVEPITYRDDNEHTFKTNMCINYYETTVRGESGSIICIPGAQGQVLVLGYHVCVQQSAPLKRDRFGFATTFTCEGIAELISSIKSDVVETQSMPCQIPFPPLYNVPMNEAYYPPRDSRLVQSALYGWDGPPLCIPVKMRPFTKDGVMIDPLIKAMGKLRTEHTPHTGISPQVYEWLHSEYPRPFDQPQLLSFDEVLRGIPGTMVTSINVGTSAGYPFNLAHKRGKSGFIKIINNEFFMEPEFRDLLNDLEEKLKRGIPLVVIWCDTLKDETRPVAKVEEGKVRLFQGCPIHFLFLCKRYFGSFLAYVKSLASEKPISVGLNVHSLEWKSLYESLNTLDGSLIAGDFENYDGSIPEEAADVAIEFINQWYNDGQENADVRRLLAKEMINAKHICFDVVYQTRGSNPSGNPMTSEYNSLIYMIILYVVLTEDFGLVPEDWKCKIYGDDSLVKLRIRGVNWKSLAPFFKKRFNMTLTHGSKEKDKDDVVETFDTVSYIGRGFVIDRFGIVRAPLPIKTIIESTYWIRGSIDENQQILAVADSYFRELSHHGRDVFLDYSDKFIRAVYDNKPEMVESVRAQKKSYDYYYREMYFPDACLEPDKMKQLRTQFKVQSCEDNFFVKSSIKARKVRFYIVLIIFLIFLIVSKDFKLFVENFYPQSTETVDSRNTEFTDRAVNLATPSQVVPLGTYNDVAPTSDEVANNEVIQLPHRQPNMETFAFNNVMDRVYNIGTYSWTTAQSPGTQIASWNFPTTLFDQEFIADKIKNFTAFQAGIQVNLRITASRTLYGKVMLVYYPMINYYPLTSTSTATFTPSTNLYHMTGNPHILASASANEVVTFTVPFISPHRYLNINQYASGEMGQFKLVVFNTLGNSEDTTATASIFVTAGFVDSKLWLPNSPVAPSIEKSYVVQSKALNKEGMKKINSTSKTNEVLTPLQCGIKQIKLAGSAMGNLLMQTAKEVAVMTILGLNKPTTLNTATIVTANPNFHMNTGNGIETMPKLALDSENQISTQPCVGGISADEMAISFFAGTPSMVSQVTFLADSDPAALMYASGINDNLTFVDHLKIQFAFWSGSFKVKTYITASIFHSVRLVFYLATDPDSDWQNCYHREIEVQGDTEAEFVIPYCQQSISQGKNYDVSFALYCKVLTWAQADDSIENLIWINTYLSGAEDFKVAAPRDIAWVCQSNPRDDFNKPFAPFHDSIQGYSHENVIWGEETKSYRDVIHRIMPWVTSTGGQFGMFNESRAAGQRLVGMEMIMMFYRFWRGSVRWKMLTTKAATVYQSFAVQLPVVGVEAQGYLQGVATSNPTMNSVEGETPFYHPCLFDMCNSTEIFARSIIMASGTTNFFVCKGGGDDFSLHWLCLPGSGAYELNTTASTTGYGALLNFYK
jgi:hypothetical protein